MTKLVILACLSLAAVQASAFETVQVTERVYALVGELGQRSPGNLGHNMTSGFIVADDGVVVVDTGGSYRGARAIHEAIQAVTDKPVKWAINTGGQDHRWLGNGYFRELGIPIVAAEAGKQDMINRTAQQTGRARRFLEDQFEGTQAVYPTRTFAERYTLPAKGITVELIYTGGGHTAGDLFVWLPGKRMVFTGDIVFVERLLRVMPGTGLTWIQTLEYLRDELDPDVVIPGHGHVTDLEEALRDTYEYLVFLRDAAQRAYDEGAFDPVEAVHGLDQSRFSYLENYDSIQFRSRNALHMAEEVFAVNENR